MADGPELEQDRVRRDVDQREHGRSIPILRPMTCPEPRMTEQYIGWALVVGLAIGGALVWFAFGRLPRGSEEIPEDELKSEAAGSAKRSTSAAASRRRTWSRRSWSYTSSIWTVSPTAGELSPLAPTN